MMAAWLQSDVDGCAFGLVSGLLQGMHFRMRLTAPPEFSSARAGQFVMVRVSAAIDPLLRRPLAIFDVGVHKPPQQG